MRIRRHGIEMNGEIVYVGPFFPSILTSEGGIFPCDDLDTVVRSFCAWYVARNCHLALYEIPGQVSMEGDTDITLSLRNTANGALQAYGLNGEDNDTMTAVMNLMPLCRRWAFIRGMTWNPRFQAWLDSGGYSYNEVTREPDAI